jgi:hypothetical protein
LKINQNFFMLCVIDINEAYIENFPSYENIICDKFDSFPTI